MATKLSSLSESKKGPKSGSKYPIDEWFDGSAWLLKQGEDFTCTVIGVKATLNHAAVGRGLKLLTRTNSHLGQVEIQAVPR